MEDFYINSTSQANSGDRSIFKFSDIVYNGDAGFIFKVVTCIIISTLLMAFPSGLLLEGERAIHSREFILSLWTSTAGVVPHIIPKDLCKPIRKTRKRGRRGGLRRRIKTLWLDNRCKLPPLPTVLFVKRTVSPE
ncbi:hypothetical protein ABVT39_017450 [Epinephelus coioides]